MSEAHLQKGIELVQAGELDSARQVLTQVTQENPNNDEGWLWLGRTQERPDDQADCYRQALAINPQNQEARALLEQLGALLETESPAVAEQPIFEIDTPSRPTQRLAVWVGLLAGLFGCLLGFLLVGYFSLNLIRQTTSIASLERLVVAFVPTPAIMRSVSPDATGEDSYRGQSLPPTWALTASPLPTTTLTPTPSSTPDFYSRHLAEYEQVAEAERLAEAGDCTEAIPIWDRVIGAIPDYMDAYYQRAHCFEALTSNQRNLFEYEDYLYRALEDINTVIERGPASPDYYYLRYEILTGLGSNAEYIVDQSAWNELALEDLIYAKDLGSREPFLYLAIPNLIVALGDCQTARALFQDLYDQGELGASASAAYHNSLAHTYLCEGDFNQALYHNEIALQAEESDPRHVLHSVLLYYLGRLEEALEEVTVLIDDFPHYGGYRYYLRGLIYYDLGMPELALQDIEFGAGNTWGTLGLRAYILGRLALDEGRTEEGIEWLELAEASLDSLSRNLLPRLRRELAQAGGTPLEPTPDIPVDFTHREGTNYPTSFKPTPVPPVNLYSPKDYSFAGTGIQYLAPGGSIQVVFHPDPAVNILNASQINELAIGLYSGDSEGAAPLRLALYQARGTRWETQELAWGVTEIDVPFIFLTPDGRIYIWLYSTSDEPIVIQNMSVQLILKDPDGSLTMVGQLGPVPVSVSPVPPLTETPMP